MDRGSHNGGFVISIIPTPASAGNRAFSCQAADGEGGCFFLREWGKRLGAATCALTRSPRAWIPYCTCTVPDPLKRLFGRRDFGLDTACRLATPVLVLQHYLHAWTLSSKGISSILVNLQNIIVFSRGLHF